MRCTCRGWAGAPGRPPASPARRPAHLRRRAMAKPILPLERLVMPPNRIDGRRVGAGADQHFPASQAPWAGRTQRVRRPVLFGLEHAPSPTSPQAWSPCPAEDAGARPCRAWATLRRVAGWDHISRFIAGASSSPAGDAGRPAGAPGAQQRQQVVRAPWASLAMKSADAGPPGWHRRRA